MGAEAFTFLAIIEAQDKISRVLEQVDGSLDRFSSAAARAAETAATAGERIDASLLETASGADALVLAEARTASAQEKSAAATAKQAQAEQALLQARSAAASEDELAAAATALAAAQEKATASTVELKAAQDALGSATAAKASEEEIAAATDAVTGAQQRATAATSELTAARERQAALVTPSDVAAAADAVTAAERGATKATSELSAAQDRQAGVQRAATLATDEGRAAADAAAAAQERQALTQERAAAGSKLLSNSMKIAALGVAAVGYESVKTAGNFESMTEHLVTDGGEAQQNIGMIRAGMLQLATTTGTTTDQMSAGMLHIESAGFHGQAGLDVLKAAAEGAKVGGADLDTVGKTLTGTMNSYATSGYSASQMMNMLIAATAQGDMKMQDLASSLGNVAPQAAAAGISLQQVLGAVSTMTSQNMSAAQATQDLNHTIQSLQNPSTVQTKEMAAMGLSSNDLAKNLGKNGLSGTFDTLVNAIATHTKGGMVFQSSLKSSEVAAANANEALKSLPPSIQGVAKGLLDGSVNATQYGAAIKDLPVSQKALAQQFEGLVKKTSSFNDLLKSGSPTSQTFSAALAKMTGGSTGLTTALMLTGDRAATFSNSAQAIGAVGKKAGNSVDDWGKIQATFNQKLDRAKASVEAAGISIGTVLLPVVSKIAGIIAGVIGPMASWIASHQKWVGLGLAVAGAIMAVVTAMKAWRIIQTVINGLMLIFDAEVETVIGPIELVIIAIAAIAAGLYYAYTHFKTFREIVQAVFSAVKTAAVDVWHALEAAWNAIASAAKFLWHALETAWNNVAGAVKAVGKALSDTWNAIWSTVTTVWNAISGFFEKWWPLLLVIFLPPIALLLAIWNHFHQDIEDAMKTAWDAILGFFKATWDFIKAFASDEWLGIKEFIIQPMEDLWHLLVSLWNTVSGWLSSAWKAISAVAQAVWGPIKTYILQPLEDAYNAVAGVVGKIGSAISSGLNSAKNTVMGIVRGFESIGSDIVNGIISGIENAGGALFKTLGNLASDALKSAKSFLGISSPSKLFASEVGHWIPAGIAQGVTANAGVAHSAVQALAGNLPGLAAGGAGTPSIAGGFTTGSGLSYAGSGAGAGGGNTTIIDLRNSQVLGNGAMDQLARKIGQQLTGQLAPAGVHIRG